MAREHNNQKGISMKFAFSKGLIVALLFSSMVHAAAKVTENQKWLQEPTAFLGINIAGNLKHDLKQCPPGYELPTEICYKLISDGIYQVWGLPNIGIDNPRVAVQVKDSSIQYISLKTYEDQFPKLKSLLIQKYGKPTNSKSEVVKTKVGASFNNEKLYWQGANVVMVLSRYSNDIETSSLTIMNETATEKALIDRDKSLKEAASKL